MTVEDLKKTLDIMDNSTIINVKHKSLDVYNDEFYYQLSKIVGVEITKDKLLLKCEDYE